MKVIFTEILFIPLYKGQAFFYQVCDYLYQYGYYLYDFYNIDYSSNGQAKWGDALFVSPEIRRELLEGLDGAIQEQIF